MSLKHLNNRVAECCREMDRQRDAIVSLVDAQKGAIDQRARRIPLPLAMGAAAVAGFIAQRFFHSPTSNQLLRLYLTWRAF